MQDGAGTDIVTVSTNKVAYGKGISEETVTVTQSSGTVTIDLAQGNFFEFTLTQESCDRMDIFKSCNFWNWTFMDYKNETSYTDQLLQTVAYPSAVHWAGGTDHVMSTATGSIDIVSMFTIDGGTTIYANIVGKALHNVSS